MSILMSKRIHAIANLLDCLIHAAVLCIAVCVSRETKISNHLADESQDSLFLHSVKSVPLRYWLRKQVLAVHCEVRSRLQDSLWILFGFSLARCGQPVLYSVEMAL